MSRRYYLSMAASALVAAAYDCSYYLVSAHTGYGGRPLLTIATSLAFFLGLNLPGAWWIFRPVSRALAGKGDAVAARRRVTRLAPVSALWVLGLGVLYTVMAVVAEGLTQPGGPDIVARLPLAAPMVLAYGVFLSFLTFFLVEDVAIDLRLELGARFGLRFDQGNGRLWRRLMLAFLVTTALPQAQLLVDMVGDPRGVLGVLFWRLIAVDMTLGLVGISVAIVFVARGVTRPIELLMRAVGAVKAGDLSVEAPIVSRDEIGHLTASFNEMVAGLRERERIRDAFGRYLEEDVAAAVLKRGAALSGEERTATILVTDIEGYTSISESMSPAEVVAMLNDYFGLLVECVRANHGIVNKFIGDSVFALYNVPLDDPEHARHAVQTALEIQRRSSARAFGPRKLTLHTRVGINTGPVVAGSIGAAERLEYTVIGDSVNVAARLEQLNKQHGTAVLCGAATRAAAGEGFAFEQVGEVALKGKARPVEVFAVREAPGATTTPGAR